jgi:hypothetical protein
MQIVHALMYDKTMKFLRYYNMDRVMNTTPRTEILPEANEFNVFITLFLHPWYIETESAAIYLNNNTEVLRQNSDCTDLVEAHVPCRQVPRYCIVFPAAH